MLFFISVIEGLLSQGKRLPKIIGHPVSLLLTFLFDENGNFNKKIAHLITNYKILGKE